VRKVALCYTDVTISQPCIKRTRDVTQLPNDFLNLLARPPGDLFYFLLVFILAQAGFFMALGQRMRARTDRAASRYTVATLGAVIAWAAVMVGLIVGVLTNQPGNAILPPLERAAQIIATLFLGWAFLTADHDRGGRLPILVLWALTLATIIGYVATGVDWAAPGMRDIGFNSSSYGVNWSAALVVLATVGSILTLVLIRLVVDAPLKMIFFALVGFGSLTTLMAALNNALPGDYAGVLRLTFVGAMLLAPAIIYRMVIARLETATAASALSAPPPFLSPSMPIAPAVPPSEAALAISERETAPVMKALGLMLERPDPDVIPQQIVGAACNVLKADVGALLALNDANYADVTYSYNKLLARSIDTFSISLASQPTLVNAIERRMQRPLLADRNEDELTDLYTRFDIEQKGPTYFQPLQRGGELLGILMVGMPYTGRELNPSEQETLKGIGIIGANLLAVSTTAREQRVKAEGRIIQAMVRGVSPDDVDDEGVVAAWEDMHNQLENAREQIVQLSRQVTNLKIELDDERSKVTDALSDTEEGLSVTGRILAINEENERLTDERDALQTRLREAEATLATATASGDAGMFRAMIDVLNRERDDLQIQRDSIKAQLDDMRAATASGDAPVPDALGDMLERMNDDKTRLEAERETLRQRVTDIEGQLTSLGVEGGVTGLAAMVAGLYEQQAQAQARYDALKHERDTLAAQAVSSGEVEKLRAEVVNLAADREAMTKQRDKIRSEKEELSARFEALKAQRGRVMAEAAAYQQELTEAHVQQAQIRVQMQKLIDERVELVALRDRLTAEKLTLENEREQLLARVEGDRTRLQELGQEGVGSLTDMIEDLLQQRAALERAVGERDAQLADLQNQLEVAHIHASSQLEPLEQSMAEQLTGLVQEFRTPMTSIIGYVDLILGESAGILGDMQRKFMQRVASNVKRLWSMTEDLHWLSVLDSGNLKLEVVPVDMVEVIEDAVTNVTAQLREKDLTVRLDLDDDLPLLDGDKEALGEVIGQLLTNAYLASPAGGTLGISARAQRLRFPRGDANAPLLESLVVAVSDSGSGIAPEDQPFVFARRYKSENPLVHGLGDTGVGLAIARTLVDAHQGDIWFESGEHGTTMFFAIPYQALAVSP
jgi:signal transduction histidine kinase